jgi:hypothetical protein
MLKFSDGITIDTEGEPRVLQLSDGYYAVGKGILIPVENKEAAEFMVQRMLFWEPSESIIKSRANKINLQHKNKIHAT